MEPGEDVILTHLRRGTVEYCILAMLRDGELYGLEIARRLGADGLLMGGEGTLYPLLARLRKAGLVTTTWQESSAGPPRRYYGLTVDGMDAVSRFTRVWSRFREAVDAALVPGARA